LIKPDDSIGSGSPPLEYRIEGLTKLDEPIRERRVSGQVGHLLRIPVEVLKFFDPITSPDVPKAT
jgi:hypothetical protein